MNTLRERLRDADPLRREGSLVQPEAARIRSAVLAAAATGAPPMRVPWLALLATSLAVVAGVIVTHSVPTGEGRDTRIPLIDAADVVTTPRQLQFLTPGGTRVIWMFNPEFDGR